MIIAELRRRAAARVRFWPGPHPLRSEPSSAGTEGNNAQSEIADLIDDEIPW